MNLKAEINEVEKKFNAFNTKCMKIKCMAHLLLADNISTQMFWNATRELWYPCVGANFLHSVF